MKKLICSVALIVMLAIWGLINPVYAATKAELQQAYEEAVKENEARKAQIEELRAQGIQIKNKLEKYKAVSLSLADVISTSPYIVKSGIGPYGMFKHVENYYLISNPRQQPMMEAQLVLDMVGKHTGDYIPAGQTTVYVYGRPYTATILERTPEEYDRLLEQGIEIVNKMKALEKENNANNDRILVLSAMIAEAGNYPSQWAETEIESGKQMGIIPEELLNNFQEYITREEFAKLTVSTLNALGRTDGNIDELLKRDGIVLPESSPFADTNDKNVVVAHAYGIVTGSGDGNFRPNDSITREEAATMLMRLIHSQKIAGKDGAEVNFVDIDQVSDWAKENVRHISSLQGAGKAIMGGADGYFSPQKNYTREQAFLTMNRLYHFAKDYQTKERENLDIAFKQFVDKTYFITEDNEDGIMFYLGYSNGRYWMQITKGEEKLNIDELKSEDNRLSGVFQDENGNKGEVILENFSSSEMEDTVEITISTKEQNSSLLLQLEKQMASTIAG